MFLAKLWLLASLSGAARVQEASLQDVLSQEASPQQQQQRPVKLPVDLVGMDFKDVDERLCAELFPFLQASTALLKRVKYADLGFFEKKFKHANGGDYADHAAEQRLKKGTLFAALTILGSVHQFALVTDVGKAIMTLLQFKDAVARDRRDVLAKGEDAQLAVLKGATFGNLWQSRSFVNGFKFAPKGSREIGVLNEDGSDSGRVLPQHDVLTPRQPPGNSTVLAVGWPEGGALRQGWVRLSDVVPNVYRATAQVRIVALPLLVARPVTTLKEGEIFAGAENVQGHDKTWWMLLSDGRGWLRHGHGYQGPLEVEMLMEQPAAREALRKNHLAQKHWGATVGRLAFSAGMFTAGFFTGGLTWGISTAVAAIDKIQATVLEGEAMTDLDVRMNFLMEKLREWEYAAVTDSARQCHVEQQPCGEGFRCIREFAFFDFPKAEEGFGWCMANARLAVEEGEECSVHADCLSGNCEKPLGCRGTECLSGLCTRQLRLVN